MYAALLGLVFGISAIALGKRALAVAASVAGVAAIYLSQVRVSLVVAVVMLAAYAAGAQIARAASSSALVVVASFQNIS